MKYCSKCGASVPDDVSFCIKCGTQLSEPIQKPPIQSQSVNRTPQQQYYASPQPVPVPQAWIQCRHCNAMIPLSGSQVISNCPICGNSMAVTAKKPTKWTGGRIAAIASIFVAFAGQFMPFLSFSVLGTTYSVQIWSEKFVGTAFIITFLLGCSILLVAFDRNSKGKFAFVSALIILYLLYDNYTSNQARLSDFDSGVGNMDLSGLLHPGAGLFLILIGCIGMIASCIAMHVNHQG